MIEQRLRRQLGKAVGRVQHARLVWGWAVIWMVMAVAGGLVLTLNLAGGVYFRQAVPMLVGLALLAAGFCVWFAVRTTHNYRRVALRIEQRFPELHACLLAAIDQSPDLPNGRYGFLQDRVIHQALQHAYGHPWSKVVPGWLLLSAHAAHFAALVGFVAMMAGLAAHARPPEIPWGEAPPKALVTQGVVEVSIEPGNAEVERGTSLIVMARFKGALPADVQLTYWHEEGPEQKLAMSKSFVDPTFGGRIRDIQEPLHYRVEFDGRETEVFSVSVFDYPALTRADARLQYPAYTELDERLVQDVRRVSAVQGTRLTLLCYLNKTVASARLQDGDGSSVELVADASQSHLYTTEMTLEKSQRFELLLTDERDRKNKRPAEFVVTVVPNKRPQLKLVAPARDVQVSPLEELDLKANARDDHGLERVGVSFQMAEGEPRDIVLGEAMGAKRRFEAQHLLAFEELQAQPDQLLSYYFWAEDIGPDEKRRRTFSDMFFAEVRPFDEIFRQGRQSPSSQQQQQQQQQQQEQEGSAAEQLAELQKQIINGTWKLFRRESMGGISEKFDEDASLLLDSQVSALEQAASLGQEVEDPQMVTLVQKVLDRMSDAVKHLEKADDLQQVDPLQPALSSEQAAYQALLALRAREHEVRRSNSSSSSSSSRQSSPRAQQQLQQLQLQSDRNRYETERLAQSQEEQQDQGNRQLLNRLRELARRQQDLNERLKELELALQEAGDEREREDLERQLKRLQEQQQEMLRDVDELMSRMDEQENQEQSSDSREQLERSRDNVRQASEALEQGMVSQAVTAGTRAQRELEQLRDDFRQRTSGRFQEEMREIQEAATELDEKEQEISQRIDEMQNPQSGSRSLRDAGERERVVEELGEQRQKLEDVMQRVQETVLEAEETEPLLAEHLYETFRETRQRRPENALEDARRSLDRGLFDDAQQQERIARTGIEQLRQGVDRAAETVLGDETEALRVAHQTLQNLVNQLEGELEQVDPRPDAGRSDSQERSDADPTESRQDSEGLPTRQREAGERPSEKPQPGMPRESQQAAGKPEPGSPSEKPTGQTSEETQSKPAPGRGGQASEKPQAKPGQRPGGQASEEPQAKPGQRPGGQAAGRPTPQNGQRPANAPRSTPDGLGGLQQLLDDSAPETARNYAPITGGDFRQWSDGLRDVEEMVSDPELRSQAARVRDRARSFRRDLRRHSEEPSWDLFRSRVAEPLVELRDRVGEELLRRVSKDALVPIDRDPVPPKYEEQVRRYYEQLGSGR